VAHKQLSKGGSLLKFSGLSFFLMSRSLDSNNDNNDYIIIILLLLIIITITNITSNRIKNQVLKSS